jgi:hypothetical protein
MEQSDQMGTGATIHIPSFIKIGSSIHRLTDTQAGRTTSGKWAKRKLSL